MLFSSSNARLANLSLHAGRHLAVASRFILDDGFLLPFGLKLTLSRWSGATEEIVGLRTDDQKLNLVMAESWFMMDHKKAKFVSVALDSFSTIDGARTDAVVISARPKDFSSRILISCPTCRRPRTRQPFCGRRESISRQKAHRLCRNGILSWRMC